MYIQQTDNSGYWLRVDPTSVVAPERVEMGSRQIMDQKRNFIDYEWLINFQESMDIYRYQWNQWVRDFNVSKQEALFKAIGIEHRDCKTLALMMAGILITTILFSLIPIWWIKRKKYHDLQKIYLQLIQVFKNQPEIYAYHTQGIEKFTDQLIIHHPSSKKYFEYFLKVYLNVRYSGNSNNKHQKLSQLSNTLQKIKNSIKSTT